jgi:uncharacterized protein YecE (DUF72 family)
VRRVSTTQHYVGTASWTDPTLLATGFYPPAAKTAESRLRFYAQHFNTVEVDSTYYALPSERNAALWAQRTPETFRFNIKAFALLTQHPAETRALPQALKGMLSADLLHQARLTHPSHEVLQLSFEMFRGALQPLREARKLACVLLQFPPWFTARTEHEAYIDFCRIQLPDDQLAIEFRHPSWFDGGHGSRTLDFLRARQLSLVNIDAPQAPSIVRTPWITTTEVAYVRFHGRNRQAWFQHRGTAADRFKYLYSDAELHECAARVRQLGPARVTYAIFNNCYADYGVRNAMSFQRLLAEPA